MTTKITRRTLLAGGLARPALWYAAEHFARQNSQAPASPAPAPTARPRHPARRWPSSVANPTTPRPLRQAFDKALDLIGGIKTLVQNKTVTVKLNLTGMTWDPVFGLPAQETYQTQPNTVAALCAILADAGARQIVLVENLYWDKPFEQVLIEAGWDVKAIVGGRAGTRSRSRIRGTAAVSPATAASRSPGAASSIRPST